MKYICPKYSSQFKCTADKCTDSCCVGWIIGIDKQTKESYKTIEGSLGEKIRKNLDTDTGFACFRLSENGRCPMLDSHGLCEIISALGDEAVSEICREHPRFYNILPDRVEWGVGLVCEEGARLIITDDDTEFVTSEGEDIEYEDGEEELVNYLTFIREQIFSVFDSSPLSFCQKLRSLFYYSEAASEEIKSGNYGRIYPYIPLNELENLDTPPYFYDKKLYSDIIKYFLELEFLDPDFKSKISTLAEKAEKDGIPLPDKAAGEKLSRLIKYFIYRYLINSLSGEDAAAKITLSIILSLLIHAMTQNSPDISTWISAAKALSKEVEYNEENLELLEELIFTEQALSASSLLNLLS